MPIDLNQCDQLCTGCVKGYKKKHKDDPSFIISCKGIPIEYVPKKVLALLPETEAKSAIAMLDPVTWAAQILDWHCLDPHGEVWKRKSAEGKLPQGVENFFENVALNEQRVKNGKSPFHRPYQAEMLRCSSKRKIFRIGRQAGKTETLVISMLHAIFTNKNFKVLLLTPFQVQIDMIFGRIEECLQANPLLYSSKKRLVKAPNYTLELHNGSYIRGFTAGTQSKGEAAQVRGQSANMIVFDEADYLSRKDLDAALAVTVNFPNATVWMSSTPSGKREKFYENCKSKMYKEFHMPSQVNPNWSEDKEREFREQLTETGYRHEILAEFGEQQEGVFQATYVDAAMETKYRYEDMQPQSSWQYCIGVDWNDFKIGTTISVVGYNPGQDRFYIVERQVVKREGWTQLAACQKILELNRKWLPAAIYIDRGYGSTQHEILMKYGQDSVRINGSNHVDSRITKILKSYDFGSQIEIRDLFTRQPVKKAAKPFLVENAVRKFENKRFSFPPDDKQLEAELRGYVVDRVTPSGIPVYKQGNEKVGDHNLDAMMLALVAFELEMTGFGKPKYDSHISFAGKFGEVIDIEPVPGALIVENKFREQEAAVSKRTSSRPEGNRTENIEKPDRIIAKPESSLPAANTNKADGKVGLWSWKSFSSDKGDREGPPKSAKWGNSNTPPKRSKF